MGPKVSLFDRLNIFSPEARIKTLWGKALEEINPDVQIDKLRTVLQKLLEHSVALVHMWMPFLDTFFHPDLLGKLTNTDLQQVEQLGILLANSNIADKGLRPPDVWARLLPIYTMRREELLYRQLIARIYADRLASWDEKTRCVRELAYRGALGDEYITLYIDYLHRTSAPANETYILNILQRLCQADFNTDKIQIKRASAVAARLTASNLSISLPGVWTAQGLHVLLNEQSPTEATKYFWRAFETNRGDKIALVGLLTGWILQGEYEKISILTRQLQNTGLTEDITIADLVKLGLIIQWLESGNMPGPPPTSTADIEQIKNSDLSKYVGDLVAVTLGKMYLLIGNAHRATEIFRPLSSRANKQPCWYYYAAWAEILVGKHETVVSYFNSAAQWTGKWTIACLLLDADIMLAEKNSALHLLENAKQHGISAGHVRVIETRLALAQSRTSPEFTLQEGGELEEAIESLRTALGRAFYMRDTTSARQLIVLPLFAHLPLADQLLWRGLSALYTNDQTHGLNLLERAATHFGYQRAAIVLAVYYLEQHNLSEGKRFLEIAANGRTYGNYGLLRAYIQGREDKLDEAMKQLELLTKQGIVRANYLLSTLLLLKATRSEHTKQVTYYRTRAAQTIYEGLSKGKEFLPVDTEALLACAEFVAYPEKRAKLQPLLWHHLERLDISRRQVWIKWNATLAQVWYGDSTAVVTAEKEITAFIDSANRLEDMTIEAFAHALVNVSTRITQAEHTRKLIQLLERLSLQSELQTVKHICKQGIAMVLHQHYKKIDTQQREELRQMLTYYAFRGRDNAPLNILLALVHLEHPTPKAAIKVLRSVQSADTSLQHLCICFADLLEHRSPSADLLPQVRTNMPKQLKQAYDMLRITTSLASHTYEQGYELLDTFLHTQSEEAISLIKVEHVLPGLIAHQMQESAISPSLIETLHKMKKSTLGSKQAAKLAHCAAAIDQREDACSLWEQSLTNDPNPDNPAREEYIKFLSHLAVVAHQQGDHQETIRRLRQAAKWQ